MTITYFDPIHSGDRPLTGEIWCPGPHKRTFWVRTKDGTFVVVSMDKRTTRDAPDDPRFTPCPGHWDYRTNRKEPSVGTRLDCRWCSESARQEYVRRFRTDRRDFTLNERVRCAELFEIEA